MRMAQRFVGKVALVTGAGSGIGEATALAFGREGACVLVADLRIAGAESTAARIGRRAGRPWAARSTSRARGLPPRRGRGLQAFGQLDILVNNAGIGATGTVLTTDEATWDA